MAKPTRSIEERNSGLQGPSSSGPTSEPRRRTSDGRANRLAEGDLDEGPAGAVGIMEGTFDNHLLAVDVAAVNRRGVETNR
jgi:hypothetical protein